MQVVELKYQIFEEFFNHIRFPGEFDYEFSNSGFDRWIYRGESSGKYKLIPNALRKGSGKILNAEWGGKDLESAGAQIRCEFYKLWQFYRIANEHGLKVKGSNIMKEEYLSSTASKFAFQKTSYKWLSRECEELAALAQHYGVPTRMLDWTFDLFTALYFASSGALEKWKEGSYDSSDKMVIWALNGGLIHTMETPIPLKLVVPPYYSRGYL